VLKGIQLSFFPQLVALTQIFLNEERERKRESSPPLYNSKHFTRFSQPWGPIIETQRPI